jgi:serine/threonine-protein kinase RsbW
VSRDVRLEALSVRSDPAKIRDVRIWVSSIARAAGFADDETRDLAVALSEVCSNSHRHAYAGRTDGRIDLEVEVENGGLRLTIRDYGAGFEASEHAAPLPAEPTEGGYGLVLIRSLMDDVKFTNMGVGTRVVLVKHRRPRKE